MEENVRQSESVPRCKYCKCDIHDDVLKVAFWMHDGLIVIEDVPARLCNGCGEQFLDEEVAQKIQQIFKNSTAEPERQIQASVYDLPQLEPMEKHSSFESIAANKKSRATLRCKYCESETVEELVKSAFWVNEQLIAIENIPARVCQQCKAQFYDDETAEKIAALDKIRTVPDGATRDVAVSVFSLANTGSAADKRYHQDKAGGLCE